LYIVWDVNRYSIYLHLIQYSLKVPVVRYVTQPATTTATTSCLSSRRGITNNETKATPTQSPTACHNPLLSEKSPTGSRVSRKHVQFPDNTSSSPSQIERSGERVCYLYAYLVSEGTKNRVTNLETWEERRNIAFLLSQIKHRVCIHIFCAVHAVNQPAKTW